MNIASLLDKAQQLMAVAVQAKQEAQSLLHKLPGFSFDETMAGPITLAGAQHPQHMEFRLHAEVPSLGEFLSDGRTEITGTVSIPDVAESAALSGSLWILPLARVIRYEFSFTDQQESQCRFAGQKDVSPLDLVNTMTVLPGVLYDSSDEMIEYIKTKY